MGLNRLRSEFAVPDTLDDAGAMRHAFTANNQRRASEGKPAYSEDEWQSVVERMEAGSPPREAATTGAPRPASGRGATPLFTGGDPLMNVAARGAMSVTEKGGYTPKGTAKYLERIPERGAGEAAEFVRGIGPAIAGAGHAGLMALGSMQPGMPGVVARQQLGRAGRAAAKAIPSALKELALSTAESYANPIGSFAERPVQTSLDALMAAEAPAGLAALGARAIAPKIAAQAPGRAAAAKGLAQFSERASLENMMRTADEGLKAANPTYGNMRQAMKDTDVTRTIVADASKAAARESVEGSKALDEAFAGTTAQSPVNRLYRAGLDPIRKLLHRKTDVTIPGRTLSDAEHLESAAMGLASPLPGKWSPAMDDALRGRKQRAAQETQELIDTGALDARTAELRRWQPLRLATGGAEQAAREAAPRTPMRTKGLESRIKRMERELKVVKAKGEAVGTREQTLADLKALLKEAREAQGGIERERRNVARASAKSAQAQKGLKPLEQIDARIAELEANMTPDVLGELGALRERRGRIVSQAPDVTKAELAKESAQGSLKALMEGRPATPTTAAEKVGAARRRLVEARDVERKGQRMEEQLAKMQEKLADRQGRVPALDRLEADTDQLKWLMPNADPAYVPMVSGPGERARQAFAQFLPSWARSSLRLGPPGYLQRSTGRTFTEGKFEPDLGRTEALHQRAKIDFKKKQAILDNIAAKQGRPVSRLEDVDWNTEAFIDPDHLRRVWGQAMDDAGRAGLSVDAEDMALGALNTRGGEGAARGYAIPKAAASELEGQMKDNFGRALGGFGKVIFDTPNDYARWVQLTLRPGFYVNNLVGGGSLAALSGAHPGAAVKAADPSIRELLGPSFKGSGFGRMEAPPANASMRRLSKVKETLDSMNEGVDDYMRAVAGISEIDRLAMKKSLRDNGDRMDKAMDLAQKMEYIGPEGVNQAARHVNDILNDYAKSAPWQKNVLRKFLPYQSFLVHIAKVAARLPVKYPARAKLVQAISTLGAEYQDEQFRESGFEPDDIAPWRKGALPVGHDMEGRTIALGTMGLNPASGLGAYDADMVEAPGAGPFLSGLTGDLGMGAKFLKQYLTGRDDIDRIFTKPGVETQFGTGRSTDTETGEPVDRPRPTPLDALRSGTPGIRLIESLLQPKEPHALAGSVFPWSKDYLPAKDGKDRRWSAGEQAAGFFGLPYRDFEDEELRDKNKPKRKKENDR